MRAMNQTRRSSRWVVSVFVGALVAVCSLGEERGPRPVAVEGEIQAPVKVFAPLPPYTEEARKEGVQGVVMVEAVIDEEGRVSSVETLEGLSHGLTESAVRTIQTWEFEPATLEGEPVSVYYQLKVRFRLGDCDQEVGDGGEERDESRGAPS